MADAAGIPVIADGESQRREVHRINQALNDSVLSESDSDASVAEKRDWCETVAAICRSLIEGLASATTGLCPILTPDGWSRHLDARRHLPMAFSWRSTIP